MNARTEEILKKINYIEADMEIQKQILHAIPSDDTDEIEKTLRTIADKKAQVGILRDEIKAIDPEAFEHITKFEKASEQFKKLAAENKFKQIVALGQSQECRVILKEGQQSIECLIKAEDEEGNWTIMTFDGEINHYSKDEISS